MTRSRPRPISPADRSRPRALLARGIAVAFAWLYGIWTPLHLIAEPHHGMGGEWVPHSAFELAAEPVGAPLGHACAHLADPNEEQLCGDHHHCGHGGGAPCRERHAALSGISATEKVPAPPGDAISGVTADSPPDARARVSTSPPGPRHRQRVRAGTAPRGPPAR